MFNKFNPSIIVALICLVALYAIGGIGHVIACLIGTLAGIGVLCVAAFIADKITGWYYK